MTDLAQSSDHHHPLLVLTPWGVAWQVDGCLSPRERRDAFWLIRSQEARELRLARTRRPVRRWLTRRRLELLRIVGLA